MSEGDTRMNDTGRNDRSYRRMIEAYEDALRHGSVAHNQNHFLKHVFVLPQEALGFYDLPFLRI